MFPPVVKILSRLQKSQSGATRRTWLKMSLVGTVSGAFEVMQAVDVLWSQPRGSTVTVSLFTHGGNWWFYAKGFVV